MMGRGAGQPGYPGGQQGFPGQRMPGQPGHPGQKRPGYGGYEHRGGPGGPSYREDYPASSQQEHFHRVTPMDSLACLCPATLKIMRNMQCIKPPRLNNFQKIQQNFPPPSLFCLPFSPQTVQCISRISHHQLPRRTHLTAHTSKPGNQCPMNHGKDNNKLRIQLRLCVYLIQLCEIDTSGY